VLELFIALLRIRISIMAEVSKTRRLKRAAAQAAARVAPPPQERGSATSDLGTADDRALDRACRAGGAADGATPRQIIPQVLARREIDPSAGFVQLQIARLSEAMIVARMMMMEGNLQAMDRVDERTRPLSRFPARSHRIRLAQMSKGNIPPRNPLKSPKTAKESQSRRDGAVKSGPRRSRREFFALQPLEIAQNREGISKSPRRAGTPLDLAEAGRRRVRRGIFRVTGAKALAIMAAGGRAR
jgi:hypothetical protein